MLLQVGNHFIPLSAIAGIRDDGLEGVILLREGARIGSSQQVRVTACEWEPMRRLLTAQASRPAPPARTHAGVPRAVG